MLPYRIISATFNDVLGNILTALKISLPALIGLFAAFGMFYASLLFGTPTGAVEADGTQIVDLPLGSYVLMAAAPLLLVATICWTAIAWHCFIVLGEQTGALLPRWPRGKVLGYAMRGLGITLLLILITFALAPLLVLVRDTNPDSSGFASFGLPDPPTAKNITLELVAGTFVVGLSLWWSTILPAYAVGRPLPNGATAGGFFRCFLPLAFLMNVVFFAMNAAATFLPLWGVSIIVVIWLQSMVGIGILTRLYLHYLPETSITGKSDEGSAAVA